MHIIYSGSNRQYACVGNSVRGADNRVITQVIHYLGKVIDKDKGIYKSKDRGYYTFDLQTGTFGDVPEDFTFPETTAKADLDRRHLDFGDVFLIHCFLKRTGLLEVIDTIPFSNKDTLHSIVCFYLLSSMANCDCNVWYLGSFAKKLYPKANLSSQRISDILAALGSEDVMTNYLERYSSFLLQRYSPDKNILIDSTGLPNSIHMPDTKVSVHNNQLSVESRLIYVVQKLTGIPIFYRPIPGNVVDVSTLQSVFAHLGGMNIPVDSCLIDAGYDSSANLDIFYDQDHKLKIEYITRAISSDKRLKEMIKENKNTIRNRQNLVRYGDRLLYIVKKEITVGNGNPAWMYLGLDCSREGDEKKSLGRKAHQKDMSLDEICDAMETHGFFGIISGTNYDVEFILPEYYKRQMIEQAFDTAKNYTKLLPLREQNDLTYRGHLLISFICACIMRMIQVELKTESMYLGSKITAVRNEKCTVYADRVVPDQLYPEVRAIYDALKIEYPVSIPLVQGKAVYKFPDPEPFVPDEPDNGKKKPGRPKGSRNKKTLEQEALKRSSKQEDAEPKKRGRPKGSRNKKTLEREALMRALGETVTPTPVPKTRGRGRPKGSKNKKTLEKEALLAKLAAENPVPVVKRGRGRPIGSKNKKTLEREALKAADAPQVKITS